MDQAPLYNSKRCVIALMALAAAYPVAQAGTRDFGAVGASTAAGTSAVSTPATYAVSGGHSDVSSRAIARRDEQIQSAMISWDKARQYYKEGKYEESLKEYKQALDILPKAPITEDRRKELMLQTADANIAVAQEYRKVGRYDEARQLLHDALRISPNNKYALRELTFLEDPVRANPALTPQHAKDVEEVNRLLNMAWGYFDLGKFDEAYGEFNKILRIDKYNEAARRGQEQVNRRRSQYYRAAAAETRAQALAAVEEAWQSAVPMEIPDEPLESEFGVTAPGGSQAILQKLKTIIIPRVDFEDTPIEDAIQFLRQRSIELDTSTSGSRGINFVINDSTSGGTPAPSASFDIGLDDGLEEEGAGVAAPALPDVKNRRIKELKLNNVPMLEVLNFICQNTGLRTKIENVAVTILPAGGVDTDLYTRTFAVPADFLSNLEAAVGATGGGGGGAEDPFAPSGSSGGIQPRKGVQDLLKLGGIQFGEGAIATYSSGTSSLLVRNTNANLDMIESIIDQTISPQRQVKIETKFVEINQENTDELGFDWVVTPFSVNDSRKTFLGGGSGTGGNGKDIGDFVGNPGGVNGWPINTNNSTVNGLSSNGLRSGNDAIRGDSLSSLITSQNRTEATSSNPAPGIMSLTGIYDEGAFQMIMRGLEQKKGSDVLTAPSIIVRPIDGMVGRIEIIREFIYPTEYEPPEIPTSTGNNYNDRNNYSGGGLLGTGGGSQAMVNSYPVTPATPSQWETRAVGVTLEVAATVSENSYVIDLEFKPEIVEFEGFVNYGSPIQSTGVGSDGKPVSVVLTDNRIEMPVFSTRKVDTKAYIYDGHTVGIGGLITESVQIVEDKIPIFGDLPFVGRFFRSNAENHNKTNLMIFVTATVVDATGQPIRGRNTASGLSATEIGEEGLLMPPAN